MSFKAIREYRNKKTKSKKRYILYFFFVLLISAFCAYDIFITTDLFVPNQNELVNSKGLIKTVMTEITKLEKEKDTVLVIKYSVFGICGNDERFSRSAYQKKIDQIEEHSKNPVILDLDKSVEDLYHINNKVVITGTTGSGESSNAYFDSNLKKYSFSDDLERRKKVYEMQYTIKNKAKVEFVILHNLDTEILRLILTQKNGQWTALKI
ncbi:hypothetical protein [Flavobacterium foetidum]|uniref:hypothetical protein n=1 Tax=Flavobacterium foetidum TaxID=2026681 RepID=UPI0010752DA1|nr:hypothetical protein [Flavobacterium foetidum]KAF2507413.1 hypothetical protein E0W73_20590 [Flavobacterium foetidum]